MRTETPLIHTHSRRRFIQCSGIFAALTALGVLPESADATEAEARQMIKDAVGGGKLNRDHITLTVAPVADNGARVPVTISVESPMTEDDYVKAIHIVSGGNPMPEVLTFQLSPVVGKAEISFYVRLAKSQTLYALAAMSDETFRMASAKVAVTIGGCA